LRYLSRRFEVASTVRAVDDRRLRSGARELRIVSSVELRRRFAKAGVALF
jgi:hypothetical protein